MLDVSFLDHLIGPPKERRRDCKAERLGRLEVDHELKLCWLLDWKFAGFGAPENLVYVGGGAPVQFRDIRTVRHQAAGVHDGPQPVDGWQSVPGGQLYDASSMSVEKGHVWQQQTVCVADGSEGGFEVVRSLNQYRLKVEPERACRNLCLLELHGVGVIRRMREDCDSPQRGGDLLEQFQAFPRQLSSVEGGSCAIATGARQARNQADLNRIVYARKNDRYLRRSSHGCQSRRSRRSHDDIDL